MQRIVDPLELPGAPDPAAAEQSSMSACWDWSSSETFTLGLPLMVQDHQSSTDPEMKSIFNIYDLGFGGNQVCFNRSVAAGNISCLDWATCPGFPIVPSLQLRSWLIILKKHVCIESWPYITDLINLSNIWKSKPSKSFVVQGFAQELLRKSWSAY